MNDDLPRLRAALAPQFADLPVAQLDALLRGIYGEGVCAEDVEGLFDDIGRGLKSAAQGAAGFAAKAAPVVGKALPAMASGAMAGSAAGPWGAAIGAAAGLTGGILAQSGNRTASGIGKGIGGVANIVSTVRGGGATGALGSLASIGTGALGAHPAGRALTGAMGGTPMAGGAANALIGTLARPEIAQAISNAALGALGGRQVAIGNQNIPVSQLLSALSMLAQRAAHEAAEYEEDAEQTPEYALAAERELGIDAQDAEDRTDALLTLLALTPSLWLQRQPQTISVNVEPRPAATDTGFHVGEQDWGEQFWLDESDIWESDDEDWSEHDGGEDDEGLAEQVAWDEDYHHA